MPPKTTLDDCNEALFCQLERLNDDALEGEDLDREVRRTDSMVKVTRQIIDANRTKVDGMKVLIEAGYVPPVSEARTLLPGATTRK